MPVRKVSELIAEIMELEKSNSTMYFFAMEILMENLLINLKKYKKKEEKNERNRKKQKRN